MKPLYEQYRPQTWSDVVGQDKAIKRIDAIRKRGLGGRAYWISGASGIGKTTIARLLAADVADPFNVEEIDATDLTPAALRIIERTMSLYGMGDRNGRAFIVNEAHGLNKSAIRQLLVLLERLPEHVVMVFTTTLDGLDSLFDEHIDAHPLLSRCVTIALTNQGLSQAFAKRAREIADREGLNGKPESTYVRLVQRCKNNMRAVLQEIESGAMLD